MYTSKITYVCVSFAATTFLFYVFLGPPQARSHLDFSSPFPSQFWDNRPLANPDMNKTTLREDDHLVESNATHFLDNLYDVQNETLGFQEVNVVSLPDRTDKRDAFAVQAALSGILYTHVDGVDGSSVLSKALPYTMEQTPKTIGCWRAHMNVLRSMVDRKVASAIIFEDDADWDVALKMQLVQFARGSRFLLNTPENKVPHSPYGDSWDLLWLGHCATRVDPSDNRRFVIPKDPTVLPPEARTEFEQPDMSNFESGPNGDSSTRMVHVQSWGSCTAAYAISLQGAEKVLYHESMLPFNNAVDEGLGNMCESKKSYFSCVSPFPTLIGVSKPAGPTNRWSDIDHLPEDEHIEENGHTDRIMFSTRQNVARLFQGERVFESQYPEATGLEMDIELIGGAVGHPEWIEVQPES